MIGMVVSPKTGQKVLGIKKTKDLQFLYRDKGKGVLNTRIGGNVGDRFNYITMENYGPGEMYPIPISKNRKRR